MNILPLPPALLRYDWACGVGLFLLTLALAVALQPIAGQSQNRIIAIGDIHGSIDGFKAILKATGLADGNGKWTGGRTQLIQTGDYTDRGEGTRAVLDLLMALEPQAEGRRRPRLGAARQSRGHEPDRRDARCDARDLRHLCRCELREEAAGTRGTTTRSSRR